MSEIYHRYQRGEIIPSGELAVTPGGLELYGEIIHFEWRLDHATSQPSLDGEVYLQKVHPVEIPLSPEKQRLLRPPDTREGRRISEGNSRSG
jgi:hypothetical protein